MTVYRLLCVVLGVLVVRVACASCPVDTYLSTEEGGTCVSCPSGKYSAAAAVAVSECIGCESEILPSNFPVMFFDMECEPPDDARCFQNKAKLASTTSHMQAFSRNQLDPRPVTVHIDDFTAVGRQSVKVRGKRAAKFVSSENQFLRSNITGLQDVTTKGFTLSLWFKDRPTNKIAYIFVLVSTAGSHADRSGVMHLFRSANSQTLNFGFSSLIDRQDRNGTYGGGFQVQADTDVWHILYVSVAPNRCVYIRLDGIIVCNCCTRVGEIFLEDITKPQSYLLIGGHNIHSYMNGYIDDVRVYDNVALYDNVVFSPNSRCRCPLGYTGEGVCLACDAGKYKNILGPDVCLECSADSLPNAKASNACVCAAGQQFLDQVPTCNICVAGKHSSSAGSLCEDCVSGKYTPIQGSLACKECGPGTSPAGSATKGSCICDAGSSYQDQDPPCVKCPAGKHSSQNASCVDCVPGKYSSSPGASECKECGFGTSGAGSMSRASCVCDVGSSFQNQDPPCGLCVAGKYADTSGTVSCKECGSGTSETGSTSKTSCVCYAGSQNEDREPPCVLCVTGKISSANSLCTNCVSGKYAPTQGTVDCEECGFGTNEAGSTLKTSCVCYAGSQYQDQAPPCVQCVQGKHSPSHDGLCVDCVEGKYSDHEGTVQCTGCGNGTSSAGSKSSSDCRCNPGSAREGDISCKPCHEGKYSFHVDQKCEPCAVGKHAPLIGATTCQDCARGKFSAAAGSIICEPCAIGFYNNPPNLSKCEKCPAQNDPTSPELNGCGVCNKGYFSRFGECLPCERHSYNEFNNFNVDSLVMPCKACPEFSHTIARASESLQDCRCIAGFHLTLQGDCVPCAPGSFRGAEFGREETCRSCAPGTVAALPRAAACTPCLSGFVALGATRCVLCALGQEPNSNSSACVQTLTEPAAAPGCRGARSGSLTAFTRVDA